MVYLDTQSDVCFAIGDRWGDAAAHIGALRRRIVPDDAGAADTWLALKLGGELGELGGDLRRELAGALRRERRDARRADVLIRAACADADATRGAGGAGMTQRWARLANAAQRLADRHGW